MSMIVFDHVTKKYGSTTALDEVCFQIDPGEFVFVTGPSGAGKTTLGRLLIYDLAPNSGSIKVGDFQLQHLKPAEIPILRRQIGVVFQDYKLLPDRTAAENISLALEIINRPAAEAQKIVSELLKVVGLETKGNLFPQQLSGGETQRVVIARALANDPAVLFADEPTGNLDDQTSTQIIDLLQKINQHGTTVIMATHNQPLVKSLKKRVIKLDHGQVAFDSKQKATQKES